ncbi:MAG TPA: electron transfer flavoprotein subunit alpha [Alphaproteobacteria bacterium]|nr:electron transfer flavoprotein subunit alpha [Alphaproteobacteria bacterium]
MTVLIITEHDGKYLNPNIKNLATAAGKISSDVAALVISDNSVSQNLAVEASKIAGVKTVLTLADDKLKNILAENTAQVLKEISANYSHIIFPSTTFGKDLAPRLAALLDVAQVSDVMEVIDESTFKRPIYAGNIIATVKSSDAKKVLTIRVSAFDKAEQNNNAPIEALMVSVPENNLSKFISIQKTESSRPELTAAKIVVSGGRGVGSKESFSVIEKLADKLGAAVGASRAAVDAGYVPNDYQVGQTGKIVAPDLYIAAGISGAIQHLAGMKDSKVVVAINKDENAPIFEVADIGIVGDLFKIIPELESKL